MVRVSAVLGGVAGTRSAYTEVMRVLLAILTVMGVAILGCGGLEEAAEQWAEDMQPIPPPDHLLDIVGTWRSETVLLVIHPEGMVEHERHDGGANTSFNAPILEWTDTGFAAGIGPIRQTFVIDVPPAAVDGVWTMTVNGNLLTRQ
jgi:hypothetical protein